MKNVLFVAMAAMTAGCATPTHKISASYASPMMFQSYTCEQLAAETYRIASRLNQLGVDVDKQAKQDKWAMGVGLVLFWPALFMVDGDKGAQSEYARLKGEYEAIQQAASLKDCVAGSSSGHVESNSSPSPVPAQVTPPEPGKQTPVIVPSQGQTDWRKWGQERP